MNETQEDLDIFWPDFKRMIDVSVYSYVFSDGIKSKIKAILLEPSSDLLKIGLSELVIQSRWTIPTADQMDSYRQESSKFDLDSRDIMVNNLVLRDLVISYHLKELIIPPDSSPVILSFRHENLEQLSLRSLTHLKRLHSGLYDVLYTKYLSEACLKT